MLCCRIVNGIKNKNIKKQPWNKVECFAFGGGIVKSPSCKSCYHQGFFAVKRRAVFILGAKWKTLVRGWRRDCVVSGMGTRFQ